jgi:hypothetical protein
MTDRETRGFSTTTPGDRRKGKQDLQNTRTRRNSLCATRSKYAGENQIVNKTLLRRTKKRVWTFVIAVVVILFAVGYAWWRYVFPYGLTHCCDRVLYYCALQHYAATHGGAFPAGEATPEASLSLLYREESMGHKLADERLLCGKTVPEEVVKRILERGELLTPETCGWHYVEGLRLDDDFRLALLWDKVGLGHNGQRLADGGHYVTFIDGLNKYIPESEWAEFMEKQRQLLADRGTTAEIRHDATIRMDSHDVRVQVRVVDDAIYGRTEGSCVLLATLKDRGLGPRGDPFIPEEEIRKARVLVEPEKSRVRFVLQGREIIYDQSGFHLVTTANEPRKE